MSHAGAAAPDYRPEILIIEDDPELRRSLRKTLSAEGYKTQEAATAPEGITRATRRPPDAIMLGLDLPAKDGLEVIRQVRAWNRSLPIIALARHASEHDKIIALDEGADDFVVNPIAMGELLARLRVALRRNAVVTKNEDSNVFRTGNIQVDFSKRRVFRDGKEVRLTRTEYKLLQVLIHHADQALTHSQLLREVWGPHCGEQSHYVRVYMGQLRVKLEADPARPKYLRTEPGIGYRLMIG